MDGYIVGFALFCGFFGLVALMSLVWLGMERPAPARDSRYTTWRIRRVDTHTIESVNKAGEVHQWQSLR